MKVLFVCSGNVNGFEVVPFIREQGEAIRKAGVDIDYFPVKGKGLKGYLTASARLRNHLKQNHYDLIHAHFILSGCTAVLASRKTPIVLSLMGSDAYGEYVGENRTLFFSRYLTILTRLIQPFVSAIISKSSNIERYVYLKQKSFIVPNGIDITKFRSTPKNYRDELALNAGKKQVLFLGSRSSVRKNIKLAQNAISYLNRNDVELINPYPVSHDTIPKYLNSVHVLAVCSYMEGSPNVVKEAMACNCPIVATNVGDIEWVFGNTEGCYIASFKPEDYAAKLTEALNFSEGHRRTRGEQRIHDLALDSETVARRVIEIYKKVLKDADPY
ncbi:MAG: glycosyltransferase [Cyclobacteriaceae bacterium]